MNSSHFDPNDLDHIAEEFAGAIRKGDRPSVQEYLARYGDSSGQLGRLLSSIEMIESLKHDAIESHEGEVSQTSSIEQLDDYTIVREIGRGGMGIVFEAIHQSLGQRVAIKVLADKLVGDSKHLARFRREARAAAKLRHTSIVPVFGVGTAEGHHYYVMDYIDGMSLQQWLEHLSGKPLKAASTIDANLARTDAGQQFTTPSGETDLEAEPIADSPTKITSHQYAPWAARIAETICDALQYAHAQGVLHRDIKPANLLLDSRGEVWIADFGLAKLNEQHAVTLSGDVVGTPQYMPPESIDGHYDVASEVYAVGLTLYELLTLHPAISGKSPGDVIRKASHGVSVSPRKLNPQIPRDLETIVLKALAHEPRQRYLSAGEMRDDLRRYLAHLPISARPFSRLERGIRWARREPVVASLTAATFALLLALAIVSAFAYLRTRSALGVAQQAQSSAEELLEQKVQAYQLADAQRIRAEKNLEVAISAFDEIMTSLADRGLEPDSEFLGDFTDTTSSDVTPEDAALLQSLLGFFDKLAANNSEHLLASSAVAASHAADIYLRLGKLSQAERTYSESLSRYRRLQQIDGDDRDNLLSQAAIMNELAMIAGLRGKLGRAQKLFQDTCDLLEESPEAADTRDGRFEAARAYRLYASLRARAGLETEIAKRPAFESPTRRRRPLQMMLQVRTEDELQAIQQSIELLLELTKEYPDDRGFLAELARAHRDRAIVADRASMSKAAESSARSAIELFEQLLKDYPDSDAIRYELAMTLSSTESFNVGQLVRSLRANQLSETLLADSPELPRYRALHAHAKKSLASQQLRIGRLRPAEDNLAESLTLYDELISDTEELNLYETQRSGVLELLADLKLRQGDRTAAIDYLERAVRRLQPWLKRNDASPIARLQLQRLRQKLGRIENRS